MSDGSSFRSPWPALAGGLIAIAASLLIRTTVGARTLAEIVVDASTYGLQPRGFSFLLSLLGGAGKPLLFATVIAAQVAVYVLAWRWTVGRHSRGAPVFRDALVAGALAAGSVLLVSLALVQFTAADLGSRTTWPAYALVTILTSALYAGGVGLWTLALEAAPGATASGEAAAGRRWFLVRIPVMVLGGAALFVIGRQVLGSIGGGAQTSHTGKPTPEVTPNHDFYIVSKNLIDPVIDPRKWRLRVGGAVRQMLDLGYDDVRAMPAAEQYTTLQCISNDVGGDLISNALWKGFPLADLLDKAGVSSAARYVSFRCDDDYTENVPLDFATQPGVMLAYEMNGEPLPAKHGFPLRLLSPGKYGMKHPKWISEIALMDEETLGYWEERGWSDEARMHTSSRIDVPSSGDVISESSFRISGLAFAGNRGISRIEVSLDGGRQWKDAVLKPALSPFTWALWYCDSYTAGLSGRLQIVARATDGVGAVQTADEAPPYPAGATGYPKVSVTLKPEA